ncbi:MAG: cytosine deaminase [Alphaproteobacteria bacterium]
MTALSDIALPSWLALPPADALRLANAHVPRCLVYGPPADAPADADGLIAVDLDIADGRVAAVAPAGRTEGPATAVDLDGGQVWPGFVDLHTHLDKGHIWPRTRNPDGTFESALLHVGRDRAAHWRAEDVAARMDFALECAYAHGTTAVRTHLDSIPPQQRISWPVFDAVRRRWAGRIDLQAVTIVGIDAFRDAAFGTDLADLVARTGGLLGAVTYPLPDIADLVDRVFALAQDRGLDLDFHVDEHGDPGPGTLKLIADTRLRRDFAGTVTCGHCCSLSVQPDAVAAAAIARAAEAELAVVSLPMCNMYLQDRTGGRTPRWRGVTLVHELAAAGVPVALASDNTRDPFHAGGDLDMVEVFAQGVRIGHLDHPFGDWAAAVARTPADVMGLGSRGRIRAGAPADLVLFRARSMNELIARPQVDRVVLRGGRPIARRLPDYRRLDRLFDRVPR